MTFEEILRTYQRINSLARTLIGRPAFDEIHVLIPDPASPEPGFIRATSWLYCLYFEAGQVSLTFLRRLSEAHYLMDREKSDQHIEIVRSLRTELHHNLGFTNSDLNARTTANTWRRKACGTAIPQTSDQWIACYTSIVNDAHIFLGAIDSVVRQIESDIENSQQHIDEWLRRLNRSWPASSFDPLIDNAKYLLARDSLNTIQFRNKHVGEWRKHLDLLDNGFNFDFEVTRLIEKTLLDEDSVVLPITGRDVIDHIAVTPGPEVGNLLEEARRYFEVNRCNRDNLLDHLRNYHDSHQSAISQ